MTSAVNYIKIDSVKKAAISVTAKTTERDIIGEYLFRICSVAANLVRSLEITPICCATTLCHFGRSRSGYITTHFIFLSSTAESSAESGYVVVPERFGQIEEAANRKEERTSKKPVFCSRQWIQSM